MADMTEEQAEIQSRHDALSNMHPLDPVLFTALLEVGEDGVHENVLRDRCSDSPAIGTQYIGRLDDYFTANWIENVPGPDGVLRERSWRLTELGRRALSTLTRNKMRPATAKPGRDRPAGSGAPKGGKGTRNPRRGR